jgi:hypothetical protein
MPLEVRIHFTYIKSNVLNAYQLAFTVVMKNCDPLESGPEFAMETTPEIVNNFVRNLQIIPKYLIS